MCYNLVSSLETEAALAVSMLVCGFTLFLGVCTVQWRLVLGVGLGVADAQLEVLASGGRCGAEQQKAHPDAGPQKLTRAPAVLVLPHGCTLSPGRVHCSEAWWWAEGWWHADAQL